MKFSHESVSISNIVKHSYICRQVNEVKSASEDRKVIIKVWYVLLTAKWTKEQRIVLWKSLPKVRLYKSTVKRTIYNSNYVTRLTGEGVQLN